MTNPIVHQNTHIVTAEPNSRRLPASREVPMGHLPNEGESVKMGAGYDFALKVVTRQWEADGTAVLLLQDIVVDPPAGEKASATQARWQTDEYTASLTKFLGESGWQVHEDV